MIEMPFDSQITKMPLDLRIQEMTPLFNLNPIIMHLILFTIFLFFSYFLFFFFIRGFSIFLSNLLNII